MTQKATQEIKASGKVNKQKKHLKNTLKSKKKLRYEIKVKNGKDNNKIKAQ